MRTSRALVAVIVTVLVPRVALACPVCFGQNDSPLASAINAGVIVMLGFVVAVLGAFGAFIVHLNRRARYVAAQAEDERPLELLGGNRSMLNLLGLPVQASQHAPEIDHMIVIVHWLMAALFVGWGAFFVFVVFRFRSAAHPVASYTGAKGKLSKGVEVGIAIIEAVLLLVYAIPAWAARVGSFPTAGEALVVRVVGEQFSWNVHYPGADGQFGRTDVARVTPDNPLGIDRTDPASADDIDLINQLNVPVDRPVLVHLSSKDVIHSFGLNEMRVKQDAIPGMDIPVWFIPNRVGDYEINCSQLCGLGHYRMRGFISVKSEADFRTWLAEEAKAQAQ